MSSMEELGFICGSGSEQLKAVDDWRLKIHREFMDSIPRTEVCWFTMYMERKLRENDSKKHWSLCPYSFLLARLKEEYKELEIALGKGNREEVIREAADVANFAMMIADNVRRNEH